MDDGVVVAHLGPWKEELVWCRMCLDIQDKDTWHLCTQESGSSSQEATIQSAYERTMARDAKRDLHAWDRLACVRNANAITLSRLFPTLDPNQVCTLARRTHTELDPACSAYSLLDKYLFT